MICISKYHPKQRAAQNLHGRRAWTIVLFGCHPSLKRPRLYAFGSTLRFYWRVSFSFGQLEKASSPILVDFDTVTFVRLVQP